MYDELTNEQRYEQIILNNRDSLVLNSATMIIIFILDLLALGVYLYSYFLYPELITTPTVVISFMITLTSTFLLFKTQRIGDIKDYVEGKCDRDIIHSNSHLFLVIGSPVISFILFVIPAMKLLNISDGNYQVGLFFGTFVVGVVAGVLAALAEHGPARENEAQVKLWIAKLSHKKSLEVETDNIINNRNVYENSISTRLELIKETALVNGASYTEATQLIKMKEVFKHNLMKMFEYESYLVAMEDMIDIMASDASKIDKDNARATLLRALHGFYEETNGLSTSRKVDIEDTNALLDKLEERRTSNESRNLQQG